MQTISDDNIDFNKYLDHPEAAYVKPLSDWGDEVMAELRGEKKNQGKLMPWSKTHDKFAFRHGELTIWAGQNGHKKSMLNTQVMLGLAAQHERVCIASFEMPPADTVTRLLCMYAGSSKPSEDFAERFLNWAHNKIWLYDQIGEVPAGRILAVSRYCQQELNIGHMVIDSLMKCGVRNDGEGWMSEQRKFISALQTHAKNTGQHVHLVAHMRKPPGHKESQDKYGVAGSADITNMADNVLIVWDNKEKHHNRTQAEETGEQIDEQKPDLILTIDKQRKGKWEGKIALWFDQNSLQHVGRCGGRAMDIEIMGGHAA